MKQLYTVKTIFSVILFSFLTSCSNKITQGFMLNNNRGGYTLQFSPNKDIGDSLTVQGRFIDIDSKKGLGGSYIFFYCQKSSSDTHGSYKFKIPSNLDSEYFFKAVSIGYKTVVTEKIPSINSDTLRLNFYLQEDETPIYHCEENVPNNI